MQYIRHLHHLSSILGTVDNIALALVTAHKMEMLFFHQLQGK